MDDDRPSLIAVLGEAGDRVKGALPPRRVFRWLRRTAEVLALATVLLGATTAGLLLHLDTPEARHVAQNSVNQLLAPLLRGRIVIGEIDELSLRHARIRSARFLDENGDQVILAYGIDARVQTLKLLRAILFEEGPIPLSFPRARIADASVTLRPDQDNIPTIAWTFLPKDPNPSPPPSRPIIIQLPAIEIDQAHVDGSVGAPISADVQRAKASVYVNTEESVAVDVDETGLKLRELIPGETSGTGTYHLRVDLRPPAPERREEERVKMWAEFSGAMSAPEFPRVPAIEMSARAELVGNMLTGTLQLPRFRPESKAVLFPFIPLERDARGQVEFKGPVTALEFDGTFELEQPDATATLVATGAMLVEQEVRLSLNLQAAELDTRTILPSAPSILVDGSARVDVALRGSEPPLVHVQASTDPTIAFGTKLPRVDAVLDVVNGVLIGSASIDEATLELDAGFSVEGGEVRYSAHAETQDLAQVPFVAGRFVGRSSLWLNGKFVDGELEGKLRGSGLGVASADRSLSAGQLGFSGQFKGPLDRLMVKGALRADEATALGERLDRVELRVDGGLHESQVALTVSDEDRGKLSLSGTVSPTQGKARDLTFRVERAGEEASGTAAGASFGEAGFAIDGLNLSSPILGSVAGSVRVQGGDLVGKLRAANVDLTRLSKLVGVPFPAEGRANVDLAMERTARGRRGTIDVELEDARLLVVSGVGLRMSATLENDTVKASGYVRLVDHASEGARQAAQNRGNAELCDGPILELRAANLEGALTGPLLRAETWAKATGAVDIAFDAAELGCLVRRVPSPLLPVAVARGRVSGAFSVKRASGEPYPSISGLELATDNLALLTKDGTISSEKLDLALKAKLSGSTGELAASATIFDERRLANLELVGLLDLPKIFAAESALDALKDAPFSLNASVPTRSVESLSTLPTPLSTYLPKVSGEVTLSANVAGSVNAPYMTLAAQAFDVGPRDANESSAQWLPPLSLDLAGTYDPTLGRGLVGLSVGVAKLPVAVVNGQFDLSKNVLNGSLTLEEAPWRADVTAEFFDMPVHAVPALADSEIAGAVSGKLELKNLNRNPSAKAELFVPALRIQDTFQSVLVQAEIRERPADAEVATASVRVEVSDQSQGKLQVLGTAGVEWAALAVPTLKVDAPGTLVMGAADFSIGLVYPLVSGALTKLDGVLNGGAEIEWGQLSQASNGLIKRASLTLTDGVAYIPQFGQELSDGKATLTAEPAAADGTQQLRIEGVEAKGTSGRVHAFATATLRGLKLEKAVGSIGIDEGEELPVTIEGVPLGKARGNAAFELTPSERGFTVDVNVENARFDLPTSSSKDVQSLDDPRGITVNQPQKPGAVARDEDAFQYKLRVGVNQTEVRSSSLNLNLQTPKGSPIELLLSDRLHASGDVLIEQGSIVLNKKKFVVDEALIRLRDEDTGNPDVNLTAHWDGASGSRVFVSYVGLLKPITEDKIRFRSDPPRSQEEIVQLLVFGENEATGVALAGDVIGGSVATSLANDLLASAFGGVLRDVLAVNVGITSATGGGYLGAQVSVSDQFSFGGTVEQVEQVQATTSQTQAGGCGDLYFDYRISRSWSLRGSGAYCDYENQTTGTSSSQDGVSLGLDVLWQLRY
jgi:translocation and assembly module TamB